MNLSDIIGCDTGPITDNMGRRVAESHDDDDTSDALAQRALEVIAAMKRATAKLPITCEMRPYKNRYTGDIQGVVLTDLFATTPGGGVGTKVMTLMIKLADTADINIYTDAEGPRSAAFYEKFGFVDDTHGGHQFVHYAPMPDMDDY